jgi:hypothetical protein
MEPRYRVATPRKEVREGRSLNPDEFAIALEQVVAGAAPEDYRDPEKFFSRTCFTRALREYTGMVLRRLAGRTENPAPVLQGLRRSASPSTSATMTLRLVGTVPPEVWNRLGTRILPKLRAGGALTVGVDFSVTLDDQLARTLEAELKQTLADLGLAGQVRIERQ